MIRLYALYLANLDLLSWFLLIPVSPRREAVSAALFQVRLSPIRCPWRDLSTPINPCGFAFLVYVLLSQFLEPLLPPSGLNLRPGSCRFRWGVVYQVPDLMSSSAVLPPHLLLCRPVSWFLLVVCNQGILRY